MWWAIIAAAALALLVYARRGPNAVWGTTTVAALIGLVVAFITGFDWWTVGKAAAIGALVGVAFDLLPKAISRRGL